MNNRQYLVTCRFNMEDLINIAIYCNSILVRYGQLISLCKAVYIKEDDALEFSMVYDKKKTFQYYIHNFNFTITDTEVLVNRSVINTLNTEIDKRLNKEYVSI